LTRQALTAVVPLAESRGTTLQLQADTPLSVPGDAAALSALVRNLADNAVRYSPRCAQVEVQAALIDGAPQITVDDSGPGIPADERERVFDRFYRRSQTEAPGSGLGLAIVRSVARQHGATLRLSDSPLGGLRVSLRFDQARAVTA
ncbi:MAG: sensor histidine kinase, partial [Rubrivivax sp.]